jgi:hypothetical protein
MKDMGKCKKEKRILHNLGKELVLTFNEIGNVPLRQFRVTTVAVESYKY